MGMDPVTGAIAAMLAQPRWYVRQQSRHQEQLTATQSTNRCVRSV